MKPWPRVSLGELLRLERRKVKVDPDRLYQEIGIYCFGRGIFHKTPRTGFEVGDKDLFLMKEGDFILQVTFAWEGAIAIVSAAEDGMYGSTRYPTFRVDESRCVPQFLLNYFRTEEGLQQLVKICPGSAGRNRVLSIKRIPEVLVPLPPLAEQRRVVARIEELAAQIHEARTLRHQAAQEAEALVGARASTIFRTAMKNGSAPLESVALLERGKFHHRPRNEPRFFGGDHPWIQIGEIESADKYIRNWTQTLNNDGLAISKKFPRGTVLISIAVTIGAVGILDFDCCVPDSIVGVTPKPQTDSEFLYHYLGYLRGHLEEIAPQSAQKNINLGILTEVPVPKVALPEQRRIVAELDALHAEVNALKRLQAETATELDAMLPAILDRAFKGEL
jgi:type I restriction enzyme, S subunit